MLCENGSMSANGAKRTGPRDTFTSVSSPRADIADEVSAVTSRLQSPAFIDVPPDTARFTPVQIRMALETAHSRAPRGTVASVLNWAVGKDGLDLDKPSSDSQTQRRGAVARQPSRAGGGRPKRDCAASCLQNEAAGLTVRPDEEALRADVELPSFRIGARRQRWSLVGIRFGH